MRCRFDDATMILMAVSRHQYYMYQGDPDTFLLDLFTNDHITYLYDPGDQYLLAHNTIRCNYNNTPMHTTNKVHIANWKC